MKNIILDHIALSILFVIAIAPLIFGIVHLGIIAILILILVALFIWAYTRMIKGVFF